MEIIDYPNYLIYDDGNIQSNSSKSKGKFLSQTIMKSNGYKRVSLCNNTKPQTFTVHRLVAKHYIPNPDNLQQVDHKDGNKLNNHISNLRWVSNMDNGNMFKSTHNPKSGHRGISKHKQNKGWNYERTFYGKRYRKCLKSKTNALCYKFIILLKIKTSVSK